MKSFDHDEMLRRLNERLCREGYPLFEGVLSRDALVRYCIVQGIAIQGESYPSPRLAQLAQGENEAEREERHNGAFVTAFVKVLADVGDSSFVAYYDGFDEQPHARGFELPMENAVWLMLAQDIPLHFLDDAWVFSSDMRRALCLFHHERLEFFGFGVSSREVFDAVADALA